ncbi:MAG: HypC/HybG/HupF family hydrogenase formation chaperone [Coriobacteriia bacterium]|nr:HypC/HybG/HupF family hydrogenase formation chaperone [Coriobacteriia bacterium]MBN2839781.1 HypC/HybG/HupF family hydrogenase formation chaperone [Coriobacteriia bacterium]
MCLAIPARIVSEPNEIEMAEVDILGVKRHVSLMMTPDAKIGDHVLVHAGFAIQKIDEDFAAESLDMLRRMGIKHADELAAEIDGAPEPAEVPAS